MTRAEIEAILAGLGNDTFAGITRTVEPAMTAARKSLGGSNGGR